MSAPNWPSSVSSRYTTPSTLPQNSSFQIVDSNNNTITETVTTTQSQQTVTCSTTVKGVTYSITVSTTDNQNYAVSWTDGTNSGSTNLSLGQISFRDFAHEVVASANVNHGDFFLGKSEEEVAIAINCAALARASELGLSLAAISGAGALIATGSIFGIEAAPFLTLFAAGAGLYGGVARAIHALAC